MSAFQMVGFGLKRRENLFVKNRKKGKTTSSLTAADVGQVGFFSKIAVFFMLVTYTTT